MVGVKFIGRLGNQLFQFAFLKYLQSNNPNKTFFFVNPHHSYLGKYFDLSTFQNLTLNSKLYSIGTRLFHKTFLQREIYIESIQVPKHVKPMNWTVYKGFYQTDWYMNHTPEPFSFRIKPKYQKEFDNLFGELFRNNKTLVVHIRRTDYLKYGKRDISLPMEYFKNRLDAIDDIDQYQVIFVSDDMEHVKKSFPKKDNYIFTSNNEIIDFQIIMNADVAIISNSSFSWWAAYLSPKNNLVYAPKNWLAFRIGKEHPKRIMTNRFNWCDVELFRAEDSSNNSI